MERSTRRDCAKLILEPDRRLFSRRGSCLFCLRRIARITALTCRLSCSGVLGRSSCLRRVFGTFSRVKRYTSKGDIVTKVPPLLLGFRHVGENEILKGKHFRGKIHGRFFISALPSVYRQRSCLGR